MEGLLSKKLWTWVQFPSPPVIYSWWNGRHIRLDKAKNKIS